MSVRFAIFLFFYIFGYDVWLFPNLHDDKYGVIDSFKPLITINKRNENLLTIVIRISIALLITYASYCVYMNPELLEDLYKHLLDIYDEVLTYGNNKIMNYHNSTTISIVDQGNIYMKKIIEEEDGDI